MTTRMAIALPWLALGSIVFVVGRGSEASPPAPSATTSPAASPTTAAASAPTCPPGLDTETSASACPPLEPPPFVVISVGTGQSAGAACEQAGGRCLAVLEAAILDSGGASRDARPRCADVIEHREGDRWVVRRGKRVHRVMLRSSPLDFGESDEQAKAWNFAACERVRSYDEIEF